MATLNVNGWLYKGDIYEFQDARVNTLKPVASSGSYNDLTDKPAVDSVVTASGANAAVASYVDAQLGVIADGSY